MNKPSLKEAKTAVAAFAKEVDRWFWSVGIDFRMHKFPPGEGVYILRAYVDGSIWVESETIPDLIDKLRKGYEPPKEVTISDEIDKDLPF